MNDEARKMSEDFGLPYDVAARINAGMDILMDDNYPIDKAAKLMLAAERQGEDAEAFARHMVKLRKALRSE